MIDISRQKVQLSIDPFTQTIKGNIEYFLELSPTLDPFLSKHVAVKSQGNLQINLHARQIGIDKWLFKFFIWLLEISRIICTSNQRDLEFTYNTASLNQRVIDPLVQKYSKEDSEDGHLVHRHDQMIKALREAASQPELSINIPHEWILQEGRNSFQIQYILHEPKENIHFLLSPVNGDDRSIKVERTILFCI